MTKIPILTNWKYKSYNFILAIVNWLANIVYYISEKVTIDVIKLEKVIKNKVVYYYSFLSLILINRTFLFILKF